MLSKASRDSRNYSGPSPGRLCACLCADGARSGQSCCEVHPERWVPLARLLPGSVLYGRCTRHRGNLPHIEFLYLGDFILFPFKSAIHGPQWENLVSSLLCLGTNTSHDQCKLLHNFCKCLLIHSRCFPSADKPRLFCIWPQGIQSPFSSNRHFSLGGPFDGKY